MSGRPGGFFFGEVFGDGLRVDYWTSVRLRHRDRRYFDAAKKAGHLFERTLCGGETNALDLTFRQGFEALKG